MPAWARSSITSSAGRDSFCRYATRARDRDSRNRLGEGPLGRELSGTNARARITCIDVFTNTDHERQFDATMAPFAPRVEKIKSRSVPALDSLFVQNRAFDVIYVDGSHARNDALMDSLLAWPPLKPDGIIIWDDYVWEMGRLP